jgi:sulfoxide reductase heme-binding subunit YedZ
VIALTSPYLWYTTRATGFVALILLTLVVALGTFVATRVGGTLVGRFELNELHRSVSIIAVVFLAIHITSTVIDS